MSKRFTDDEKWRDAWFRRLKPALKLLWLYLCDVCDVAGVWEPDFASVRFDIGVRVGEEEARAAFGGRVEVMASGKWRLVKFLPFQQPNGLTPKSPAHRPIIALCEKHGIAWQLRAEDGNSNRIPTPYPSATPQVMVKSSNGSSRGSAEGGQDREELFTPKPADTAAQEPSARDIADRLGDVINWRNRKDEAQERTNIVELASLVGRYGLKTVHEAGEAVRMREGRKAWVSEANDALARPAGRPAEVDQPHVVQAKRLVAKHGWERCREAMDLPMLKNEGEVVHCLVCEGRCLDLVRVRLGDA